MIIRPGRQRMGPVQRTTCIAVCMGMLLLTALSQVAAQPGSGLRAEHVTDIQKDFNQPTEVAVDRQGTVFVLDGANQQIKVFNAQWQYLRTIGRRGQGRGEFLKPVGIDIDAQGNLLVADTGNRRIQILDNRGKYLSQIDLSQHNARPVEVKSITGSGWIYVSDAHNHQILVFTKDGTFKFAWGQQGDRRGDLRFPGMMAADGNKDIYIVDILNGRIQIFDYLGRNPKQVGELGVLPGQLYRPKGVVTDGDSDIYVSDSYTGVIQVFHKSGELRGLVKTAGGDSYLRLTTPLGMAIDAQGRLYVVQSSLNKVSVFNLQ